MDRLRDLIEQSRHWASANRGRTLFKLVAEFFQQTFGLDAGLFVYKKQFILEGNTPNPQIYHPWGLKYSAAELSSVLEENAWIKEVNCHFREGWRPTHQLPDPWRSVWSDSQIEFVGSWPLIVKGHIAGDIVVGQKSPSAKTDENLMSLCSTYVSFVLEMLSLRRIAEFHSQHEPLTGLLNRRGFEERFHELVGTKMVDSSLLIGILDVNNFKAINDNHGHIKGDAVLQEVASVLKKHIGSNGMCARFGGDEFVFALHSLHDDDSADCVAREVTALFSHRDYSVSVGCAVWNKDGTDWSSCFRIADKRLYKGKALDTT
ncbi:GGDEF domain-containing protein [Alicyclobacillus sp. SO9]|uniref:GGDEF domain-containing protein n=1 Tax=Alicyclobacillus sp. SO9 TaxID=2665646 RepID=UPI0018E81E70|nr:GGDEF domain-containing protein [Alicyclobacillus sp. SO9]